MDVCSRYIWIYFLQFKSKSSSTFLKFKNLVENLLETRILWLQIDGGGEFKPLIPFLSQYGIEHRLTCPHTSQQNGLIERKHKGIVNIGLLSCLKLL